MPAESDETRTHNGRDRDWDLVYRVKALERWRAIAEQDLRDQDKQIRALEDWKLSTTERHKSFVRWVGIMSACFGTLSTLVSHFLIPILHEVFK
jgi:hypothetical protein